MVASGLSASGASGTGLVFIVSLSAMFSMFPFENISVSSFIPDDRKWALGEIMDAKVEVGASTSVAAGEHILGLTGNHPVFTLVMIIYH